MTKTIDIQGIDEQIQFHEQEIQRIKDQAAAAERREEGFEAINSAVMELLDEYGISWDDFLARQSIVLGDFITGVASTRSPDLVKRLSNHFLKEHERAQRKKYSKLQPKSAGKLEAGVYRHPLTLETCTKKTRAPKLLNEWVAENGLEKVQGWMVD